MSEFRLASRIQDIAPQDWDALHDGQVFLRHAFLAALEETGCVGPATGWRPAHATLWDADRLIAAAPAYLKSHSWGEYVFDWSWAEAYARHGLEYYPKWLCAIPFSPVPGQRLLARSEETREALLEAMLAQAAQQTFSSLHILFADTATQALAERQALLARQTVQFHWHNPGHADFNGFLDSLSREKRKKIRQERRKVADAGVRFRILEGPGITEQDWAFFHRCHTRTCQQHGGTPYLSLEFFLRIGQTLPAHCVLLLALREDRPIAASLLLRDAGVLYGRYWGALETVSCLHFEACYYRPIEYAIANAIQRFEGGAQGEHKLARGLDPVSTRSLHWIAHPDFRAAIARFTEREATGMAQYVDELNEHSAYRR